MAVLQADAAFSLESKALRLELQSRADGTVFAELRDLTSGASWGPSAVATPLVYDRPCQRTITCDRFSQRLEPTAAGAELHLTHDHYGLCATVELSIEHGELLVRIRMQRIVESKPEVFLFAGISILPDLLSVQPQDHGHLVLPVQTGSLCYPDRHQRLHDSFLIYGQQHRWEDLPLLPFTAAVRSASNAALLAIAAPGDCDAECHVHLDGHGSGHTGFTTRFRYTPIDPVDPIERVIRFVPLKGADANYAGVGRRLHRFIAEQFHRRTLIERAKDNPAIEYALSSYVLKVFHAHKSRDICGKGRYQVWTTFEQAARQLSVLHRHGIDRVWVQSVGWNPEGHDGMWPTRFPVDPALGGEEGLRRLAAHGKALGYMMQVHDNYIDHYRLSPDFDADHCVGSLHGGPLRQAVWSGGLNHRGWGLALPNSKLRDQMQKVKDLGIEGVAYLDGMGMPLEISYNPQHGERRYRRACGEGIAHMLKTAGDVFGGASTEIGFLYCALDCDQIATALWPQHFTPFQHELVDRLVPVWHMAMKGYLGYSADMTHRAAVEGSHATLSGRMLNMAEVGSQPRMESTYVVPTWGAYPLDAFVDAIELDYDLMCRRLQPIALQPLQDHTVLDGDPALGNHVTQSRYGDGTTVLCDYGNDRLEINGENYALPVEYVKKPREPLGTHPDVCTDDRGSKKAPAPRGSQPCTV